MARIPLFLAPAFAEVTSQTICRSAVRPFSSTACDQARSRTKRKAGRDSNKQRGVSAMRSTGTRYPLSVEQHYPQLPRPTDVSTHVEMENYKTDPNHGLYGFFNEEKTTIVSASQETAFGRSWTESDLIFKSFEDLHTLYWECHLEHNRIQTRKLDHGHFKLGFGMSQKEQRLQAVKETKRAIRATLIRRDAAWQEAKALYDKHGIINIEKMLDEADEKRRLDMQAAQAANTQRSGPTLPMPNLDD